MICLQSAELRHNDPIPMPIRYCKQNSNTGDEQITKQQQQKKEITKSENTKAQRIW